MYFRINPTIDIAEYTADAADIFVAVGHKYIVHLRLVCYFIQYCVNPWKYVGLCGVYNHSSFCGTTIVATTFYIDSLPNLCNRINVSIRFWTERR